MTSEPRVLVVEDDPTIGDVLVGALSEQGYDVVSAPDGGTALAAADRQPVDLALLDLGLPDLDGNEVCRRLRDRCPEAIVIILTARAEEMDVVVGLEAGAADYLTKPVRLAELLARVRAHLRRGGIVGVTRRIEIGDLRIDTGSRRVRVAGHEIDLRAREFDLLERLAREPGVAVSRDRLMADVWDEHWFGSTKTLDVHVAAVRRRLAGRPGAQVPTITTLRGHGYRLDPPGPAGDHG
ncbi:chemotaxis protein CheY [Pseudonocardia sp. EC080625-04]|uniref:response regulator transcription factor n=1 Tax=Pseudonocardia sp. EC080625-04 TaxID=1096868 RepID=UPI0006CB4A96|nr:response regulator transcription factor [Pseudonocardia sp. EC080625-04]ALE73586.1 chemotaxis protein CheY [Pseudonocardia sp. EC080625-04]